MLAYYFFACILFAEYYLLPLFVSYKRLCIVFLCFPFLACKQQGLEKNEIPAQWIEKLQKYDYKTSANELVREFQTYIAPDSLTRFDKETFLSPMFVNLDEDKEVEVMLLIGGEKTDYGAYTPHLCILKQKNGKWFLIHKQEHWKIRGGGMSLQIADDGTPNKIFYFDKEGTTGSEIYLSRTLFFKLIRGKVLPCLDIISHNIHRWLKSEEIQTKVSFGYKKLSVAYDWHYSVSIPRPDGSITTPLSLIKSACLLDYNWNETTLKYEPVYNNGLTKERLAFFEHGSHLNDTFKEAFAEELQEIEKKGTETQKQALKQYFKED